LIEPANADTLEAEVTSAGARQLEWKRGSSDGVADLCFESKQECDGNSGGVSLLL
jgi:hypothetical protein